MSTRSRNSGRTLVIGAVAFLAVVVTGVSWMSGWGYAFDHPHHAVTGAEGRFELPHLLVGKLRLAIRQPDENVRREVMVEIIAGKANDV